MFTEEWVEGNYYESSISGCYILKNRQIRTRNAKTGAFTVRDEPDPYEVDPGTVGQYIGVSDKFRKKLFEGDLVVTKYGRVCLIVWHDGAHCWDLLPVGRFDCAAPDKYDIWEPENLEKIGNQWDNPELMEVKK